jgi:hypothetical protein
MKILLRILFLAVILLASFSPIAGAHKLQPAYMEIREKSTGTFNILWKSPLADEHLSAVT